MPVAESHDERERSGAEREERERTGKKVRGPYNTTTDVVVAESSRRLSMTLSGRQPNMKASH